MTKRQAFFSNETVQALRILTMNHMTREQMRGSWAGAMGNMQFMPSTFMKWGVDRDGNGRVDLWHSLPDAFASAANFLRGIGWRPGLPPSDEVLLPQGFPLDQADTTVEKPVRAWAAMGVRKAGGAPLPNVDEASSIILPAGYRGPAFILYPNFKAVMNWNRSTLYALSVSILAQQIAGGPPVMQASAGRRRAAVAQHHHRHAEPPGPAHPVHRRDRRPARPQDPFGSAAVSEADRHAGRRPPHARARASTAAGRPLVPQAGPSMRTAPAASPIDTGRLSASSPSICTGWRPCSPASLSTEMRTTRPVTTR